MIVYANSGQSTIESVDGGLVSSAVELDAIRFEIIELRRFVVILGGIFFGFKLMEYLYRAH